MVKVKRERLEDECKESIDRLPNELLELILGFLSFKEAVATSILSRRWRYLWILSPKKLDIDGTTSLRRLMKNFRDVYLLQHERSQYIEWVNRLITSLKSSSNSTNLEEFRVLFNLSESETACIDDWLSYAVSRKVERLELNLVALNKQRSYNFPYKRGNFPSNLGVLKKLCMNFVNVSGEGIGFLLGNCPLLEQLSVSNSEALYSLEIIGTFPSFKCLELDTYNLNSIVVRDSDVVCIKYRGGLVLESLSISNVPLLTELWISAVVPSQIRGLVRMFESVLVQLHMLKIYVECMLTWRESVNMFSGVKMPNLKVLVVSLGKTYEDNDDPLPVSNLMSASPRLQKFVIEATHQYANRVNMFRDGDRDVRAYCDGEMHRRITRWGDETVYYDGERHKRIVPRAYFHLKEVEFVGYRGVTNHVKMIMELVKYGVALESIVVDPRSFEFCWYRPWDRVARNKIEDEIFARAHAKNHLKKYIPNVMIL